MRDDDAGAPSAGARLRGRTRRPDGSTLAWQVQGPRDAPALLLLQGQANHHGWWDRVRGDFADRLTITFDYRGTGATRAPLDLEGEPWSTALFADDAAAVVSALGRGSVDVYGTSMGGRVAQELVLRHPERVRRLVLGCTSPGGREATERSDDVRRALSQADPDARLRATVDLFYRPSFTQAWGGVDGVPTNLFGDPSMTPEAARRHLRVSAGHDALERLDRIQAPTLVMHGTDDEMVPAANAQVIADRVPAAELMLVDGGRHGFFHEDQDVVSDRVRRFLDAP